MAFYKSLAKGLKHYLALSDVATFLIWYYLMKNTAPQVLILGVSPLIKITLISLYGVLTLPLPFLAAFTQVAISPMVLWLGIGLGLIFLIGALSEKVILDEQGIQVTYPAWLAWILRKNWSLQWLEIKALKLRTTGQGGFVYYFTTNQDDRAYLLPMRVAGFKQLVEMVQAKTQIDTTEIKPLAQPWMYFILLALTLFLGLIDAWTIWTTQQISLINS